MPQVTNYPIPDDQISPKVILLRVVTIKDALIRNWKLILILSLLGYGIGYLLDIYLKKETQYEATVLFNLGGGSGGGPGFGDMAGLLGLNSTPDANIFTGENFFYFIKSRPVVERALMKEVEVGDKKILLANFYIDSSAIKRDEWEEKEPWHTFHFTKNDPKKFTLNERLVLNEVVNRVRKGTEVQQPDRKSSFTEIRVTVENPILAKIWANTLLETVEEVYTENQTSKTRRTLRLLTRRADSLAAVLGSTEGRLARQIDYSTSIIDPAGKVQVNKLQRSSEFVTQLYAEAMRNVESMKVSLVREAPLFTIIEPVNEPVDPIFDQGNRSKIGLLVGIMFSFIIVYLKVVYKSIMEDPSV